ncbi:MAG TPA: retropepsin-like aspartic protease [Parvularculaceae bacterium]|nr:retropepsin-like aspartic protease [Parvularculaceae bacterium]
MHRLALLFLVIAAMAPASAASEPKPIVTVLYRLDYSGWITIPVTVNGAGPYDFIVDTGATKTLAFQNLADVQGFRPANTPPQFVLGLGSSGTHPTFLVGEVAVGPARLSDLTTVVLPDWQGIAAPAGLLGLDFLSNYIVVFDAEAMQARFYPAEGETPAAIRRWSTIKLAKNDFGLGAGDLYFLKARLDDRSIPFLVDLGASGTLINRAAYNVVTRSRFEIWLGPTLESGRITDARRTSSQADAIRIKRFRIARRAVFYDRVVLIQDAQIFADLGQTRRPFGLLGDDLLRDRSFAVDIAHSRLMIGPARKAG